MTEPWLWVGLLALLVLSFGGAMLLPNEVIYLIGPLRVTDPSILADDIWVGGDPFQSLFVVFRVLAAPLWWISDDPLVVALMGRLILWLFVLAGLRSLARAFALPAWAWAAGVALYISTSRGIAAGEWIFGGAEQKPLAYGAAFFAFAAMARGRPIAAAIWVGFATTCHPLIGGWSAVALLIAGVSDARRLGWGRLMAGAAIALVLAGPIVVFGLGMTAAEGNSSSLGRDTAEATVRFVTPHHLDPFVFLNPRTAIEIPLVFASALWLVFHVAPASRRRVLTVLTASLVGFYLAGFVARSVDSFGFLVLFPFRVADAVILVLFWLCVPVFLVDLWKRRGAGAPIAASMWAVTAIALLFFVVEVRHLQKHATRTLTSWSRPARAELAGYLAIYEDVRTQLPLDAVVAAAPCETHMSLYGRRALVASYKSRPASDRIHDWIRRIEALQGGRPIERFTYERCQDARVEFARLDPGDYLVLHDRYGASHALVDAERDDLASWEIARRSGRSLVDLDEMANQRSDLPHRGRDSDENGASADR